MIEYASFVKNLPWLFWLKCGNKFPCIEFVTNFSYLIVLGWYSHGAISNISTEKEQQFQTSGHMEPKKVNGRLNNRIMCALQFTVWFRNYRTNSCFRFSLFILYRSASGQSNDRGFHVIASWRTIPFRNTFQFSWFLIGKATDRVTRNHNSMNCRHIWALV